MKLTADFLSQNGAQAILRLLAEAGHHGYFVGGCVRNAVMGAGATDIDMCSDAPPEVLIALCDKAGLKTVPTGIDHGTVTVVTESGAYEVTTFRRDVETHGRHATVAYSTDIHDDAARRDFTMNALYADAAGLVLDPTGQGLDDLAARRLRFIGDAQSRIREDYLRILRFFRFHAWYAAPEAGLDAEALAACAAEAEGIETLSRERIGAEMRKLLSAPDPAPAMASMAVTGVLMRALPGADAGRLAVLVHIEDAAGLSPDWLRRLALIGGVETVSALRLSNAEAKRLTRLREGIGSADAPAVLGYRLGAEDAADVLALRAALGGGLLDPDALEAVAHGAAQGFPLKAADVMGRLSGPAVGRALRALEAEWIASGFRATAAELCRDLDRFV